MNKTYQRVTAGGGRGLTAPWDSPAKLYSQSTASACQRAIQVVVVSFLAAFCAGATIGAHQTMLSGGPNPVATATLAYRSVGSATDTAIDWTLDVLSLDDHAAMMQDGLEYLCVPYQATAFAGAYITTVAVGYVGRLSTRLHLN